jgi:type III secretory pathway component EscS
MGFYLIVAIVVIAVAVAIVIVIAIASAIRVIQREVLSFLLDGSPAGL